MTTTVIDSASAAAVWASGLVDRVERRLRAAMVALDARLERRARYAVAIRQLRLLSDRELHDIGIGRSDIPRVAREANFVR